MGFPQVELVKLDQPQFSRAVSWAMAWGWILPWQEALPTCLPPSTLNLLVSGSIRQQQVVSMDSALGAWLLCFKNPVPEIFQFLVSFLKWAQNIDQLPGTSALMIRKCRTRCSYRRIHLIYNKGKYIYINRTICISSYIQIYTLKYALCIFSHKIIVWLEKEMKLN